jgi:glucose-like phosphotransferase system IIB component
MSKYKDEVQQLVELIGGEENIISVAHCATRMRFVLKDDSAADATAIKKLPSTKGVFNNAGQFQVIIGNDVPTYYRDFMSVTNIKEVSKDELKEQAASNQKGWQKAIAFLGDVFVPIIPALVAGGLMLGLGNLLGDQPFMINGKEQTLTSVYPWAASMKILTDLVGGTVFGFLPAYVTWSATKKLGGTPILGMVLGIILVNPMLLNAYAANGVKANIFTSADVTKYVKTTKKEDTANAIAYNNFSYATVLGEDSKTLLAESEAFKNSSAEKQTLVTADLSAGEVAELLSHKGDEGYSIAIGSDEGKKKFLGEDATKAASKVEFIALLNSKDEKDVALVKQLESGKVYRYGTSARGGDELLNKFLANDGKVWDLGITKVNLVGYQALVLPALAMAFVLVAIENFMRKYSPDALKIILVPFVSIALSTIIAFTLVGPATRWLGDMLALGVTALFTNNLTKGIGAILFGAFYAPLVLTGLHHTLIAVDLQLTATNGGTMIWPMIAVSNATQAAAALAVAAVYKKSKEQKELSVSAAVSAAFGITEPAMFGSTIKFRYPLFAAMIGSAVGALIVIYTGVLSNGIGVGGPALSFLAIKPQNNGVLWFVIAEVVAMVLAIALTLAFAKIPKLRKLGKEEEDLLD